MEREIMMDQIRMGEIDKMENYKRYNLRVDNVENLNIDDNDEFNNISSDDSQDAADKDDGEDH